MPKEKPKHKVLVVDDESKVITLAKKFLSMEGYELLLSQDPMEALEILEEKAPISVIFSDDRMPNMRGTEFLEKAKTSSPDTVRILTTAFYDASLLEQSINKAEVFRFLKKPLDMEAVKDSIKDGIAFYEEKMNVHAAFADVEKKTREAETLNEKIGNLGFKVKLQQKFSKTLIGALILVVCAGFLFDYYREQKKIVKLESTSQKIGHWVKYGNGTALDTRTGMIWMTKDFRIMEGRQPLSWDEAMEWAGKINKLRYAGAIDWRLPSIAELDSIYDEKRTQLAYDNKDDFKVGYPSAFESGGGYGFWSREQFGENQAKLFFFIGGYDIVAEKSYSDPAMSIWLIRATKVK